MAFYEGGYGDGFEDVDFEHYGCLVCGKTLKRARIPHRRGYWGFGRKGALKGLRTMLFTNHRKRCAFQRPLMSQEQMKGHIRESRLAAWRSKAGKIGT